MEKRAKARLKSRSKKTKSVKKSAKKVKRKAVKNKITKKVKPVKKSSRKTIKKKSKKLIKKNVTKNKIKKKLTKTKIKFSDKPLTLDLWDKVRAIKIKNKEDSLNAFVKVVDDIGNKKYDFKEGVFKEGNYYIVNEENRNGSSFVHIVPVEAYPTFSEIMKKMPNVIIGFSILCGKNRMRDLRVSCFGISSSEITKALIKR